MRVHSWMMNQKQHEISICIIAMSTWEVIYGYLYIVVHYSIQLMTLWSSSKSHAVGALRLFILNKSCSMWDKSSITRDVMSRLLWAATEDLSPANSLGLAESRCLKKKNGWSIQRRDDEKHQINRLICYSARERELWQNWWRDLETNHCALSSVHRYSLLSQWYSALMRCCCRRWSPSMHPLTKLWTKSIMITCYSSSSSQSHPPSNVQQVTEGFTFLVRVQPPSVQKTSPHP